MQKLAAILFIIGSIGFIGGAIFFLGPTGFFGAEDAAAQIAAIENHPTYWTLAWLTLPLGGVIAGIGMLLQASHFHQMDGRRWVTRAGYTVAVGAFIGSLTYLFNGFFALTATPERYLELGDTVGGVMFMTFSVTTVLAMITFGVIFFRRGRRKLGGMMVGFMILSIVTFAWTVPLTSYVPLLIAGLVLLRRPESEFIPAPESEFVLAQEA